MHYFEADVKNSSEGVHPETHSIASSALGSVTLQLRPSSYPGETLCTLCNNHIQSVIAVCNMYNVQCSYANFYGFFIVHTNYVCTICHNYL